MGLAMAREAKTPGNERGLWGANAGVIYASEQVHMAVPKAVAMLGHRPRSPALHCRATIRTA